MNKPLYLGLLGLIFALILFFNEKPSESKVQPPVPPSTSHAALAAPKHEERVSERDRDVLRKTWFENAYKLANESKDPEALRIATYIRENSVLCEPNPSGARALEAGNNESWFGVVPMISGDGRTDPEWALYESPYGSGGVAHYKPDGKIMILKSHIKCSPVWQGLTVLHEGRHALAYTHKNFDPGNHEAYCAEERDTHEFQNRIMSFAGGKPYDDLVERLSVEMAQQLASNGLKPGEANVTRQQNFSELDTIFGPALSDLELDFRNTCVWVHAHFRLLEKSFSSDKVAEEKLIFLANVYSAAGLLPQE